MLVIFYIKYSKIVEGFMWRNTSFVKLQANTSNSANVDLFSVLRLSIKDFVSKIEEIHSFLPIYSRLLKKF